MSVKYRDLIQAEGSQISSVETDTNNNPIEWWTEREVSERERARGQRVFLVNELGQSGGGWVLFYFNGVVMLISYLKIKINDTLITK